MNSGWAGYLKSLAAQLTLALFALRALLPVGYMPDVGAAADGQVRIVLCTGFGSKTVLVDAAGKPVEDADTDTPGHDDCPFGTATASAFLPPTPAVAPVRTVSAQDFLAPGESRAMPPPAQGPPVGPRAPPLRLG